ncbi:unnamed protein product [Lactuca virosa]|uniref:Uncharacterized protein n=1 Tax=Lactuca virosa TaxID=75947 RepID=A0AAU9P4R7_9ASTR|nr:unnamed protein product [Lactuca virosa]
MLRTLRVNQEACRFWPWDTVEKSYTIRNETAIAIGENLPELRHLELIENYMSYTGLQVILDGCCHLELLDLRQLITTHLMMTMLFINGRCGCCDQEIFFRL